MGLSEAAALEKYGLRSHICLKGVKLAGSIILGSAASHTSSGPAAGASVVKLRRDAGALGDVQRNEEAAGKHVILHEVRRVRGHVHPDVRGAGSQRGHLRKEHSSGGPGRIMQMSQ